MHMQMMDILSAIIVAVNHQTIAGIGNPFAYCKIGGNADHVSDERFILFGDIVRRPEFNLWDDQDMNRRLWGDVVEGKDLVVVVDDIDQDLAAYDL